MICKADIKQRKTTAMYETIFAFMFLTCGCAIYLLFRSKALNIYHWCTTLGFSHTIDALRSNVQNWNVTEFVKFSLPDGLYCAAYILIIDAIWHNDRRVVKYMVISIVPIISIGSEILQYFGLVKGTFDKYDLICYITPTLIFIGIIIINHFKFNNKNREL